MDKTLEENDTVLAHRLCGAGNGGFFLTFSKKNTLKIPLHCVKVIWNLVVLQERFYESI